MGSVIGQYGKVIKFEVSDRKVLTFSDMERTQEGRWKDHEIPGVVPQAEFVGPSATTMTLKIKLKAQLGVKPRAMIAALERCARNGSVDTLVIGGSKYGWGSAKWIVTSVTDKWDRFIGGGLMEAGCTVEFKEYAESSKTVTVIKKAQPAAAKKTATTTAAKKTASTPSYNVEDIARRVIKGEFGTGQARFDKLSAQGYDWKAVQNKVNELLGCRKRY